MHQPTLGPAVGEVIAAAEERVAVPEAIRRAGEARAPIAGADPCLRLERARDNHRRACVATREKTALGSRPISVLRQTESSKIIGLPKGIRTPPQARKAVE